MAAPQPVPILELGESFYDAVEPARFPTCTPRFLNRRWAERLGLADLRDKDWPRHFCRFEPLPGNLEQPLALRYHGHQFRVYNPDIGDGRGFLFAQLRDADGRLLDLGTKGSGQTPYSRSGDGRLTLKGGVREVLATEMLEALGVNTSKSFALFETGEELWRGDEPSPTRSSVLTRLSHGHIRIGNFQRLAFFGDAEGIAKLARYSLSHLLGEPLGDDSENAARLLDRVCSSTATLAASYIAAGFVHGVLNSDNINITGESFDYGPWRFAPEWDEEFVAAYFDEIGLYAFGRQPEAIHWDVAQLAGCLAMIGEAPALSDLLGQWPDRFQLALSERMLARLGIGSRGPADDRPLVSAMLAALRTRSAGIDRFFFDWRGGRPPGDGDRYRGSEYDELRARLDGRQRPLAHPYWSDPAPCSLQIDEVENLWAAIAERDDWSRFESKIDAIRRLGDAMTLDAAA